MMRDNLMIGVLAFGSLIKDPGSELSATEIKRIHVTTPFNVEFGRYSRSRSGAPTLVPVIKGGAPVKTQILVLDSQLSLSQVADMLWRRETHQVCSGKKYRHRRSRNAVRVREIKGLKSIDNVLFTDFYATSKIRTPKPENLARLAISSAKSRNDGKDGITYLIDAKQSGIYTPLIDQYEKEILRFTNTASLRVALERVQKEMTDPIDS